MLQAIIIVVIVAVAAAPIGFIVLYTNCLWLLAELIFSSVLLSASYIL